MLKNISKTFLLIFFALLICCVMYPALLWAIGKIVFPFQAEGSVLFGPSGKPVGSALIAQPFTRDEYFQPRPSAASYNATASSSAALAASNYQLRSRVAMMLGPIICYKSGPNAGKPVAPDIEKWFQRDTFQGAPSIVGQWADSHNANAQAWVSADSGHARYVNKWAEAHASALAQFIKDNPGIPKPAATDLAVVFFKSFSKENPGKFPGIASGSQLGPISFGADIQSNFFDMWRQDNPGVTLKDVPGDMVTTSASGLDPHITLENALFQLDRVAPKWAALLHCDSTLVRTDIQRILDANAFAPLNGLVGEKMVNVLKINLDLDTRFKGVL
jgi:potassium-transporting ATPase KdpC subunit